MSPEPAARDEQPTWSESAYLDGVSADGRHAFVVRIARYPARRTGWLWVHVFLPGGVFAFHDETQGCGAARTRVDGPDASYALEGEPPARLWREGPRQSPAAAHVEAQALAHADAHAPFGAGPVPVSVRAALRPTARPGGSLAGRAETHGRVRATLEVDGRRVGLDGLGQWHEQHQEAPRFRVPFTYATLRGDALGLVGLWTPRGSRGFVRRGDALSPIAALEVGPRAPERDLRIRLADGGALRGRVSVVTDYSVAIGGRRRPGTIATAQVEGEPLSGCVNDWLRED